MLRTRVGPGKDLWHSRLLWANTLLCSFNAIQPSTSWFVDDGLMSWTDPLIVVLVLWNIDYIKRLCVVHCQGNIREGRLHRVEGWIKCQQKRAKREGGFCGVQMTSTFVIGLPAFSLFLLLWNCVLTLQFVILWQVAETDIRWCKGADIQVGKERLNTISDW